MLQQFLRLIGASEAPWANNPLSGLKPVRETNTATIPPQDGPLGLDGGVTTTHSMTNQGGVSCDAVKAEAIVPKVLYSNWNMECMYHVPVWQSTPNC